MILILILTLTLYAQPARADAELQVSAFGGVAWTRSLPTLKSEGIVTPARDLGESRFAVGGPLLALGGGVDAGLSLDDRVFFPGFGFAGYAAVGSYDSVLTSADGSVARASPWTTYRLELLLPGIGYRIKHRRFMFVASLRTGVSGMFMNGSIAGGSGETPTSLYAKSGMLQVELEACRRLDPGTRVCAQLAPRIYDFGFINGATLGLRIEWGR